MEYRLEAFKDNPKVNKFYFTEDGTPFEKEGDAINHANVLKKAGKGTGKRTLITRAQAEQMLAEAAKGNSKSQEGNSDKKLTPRQVVEQELKEAIAARDRANDALNAANAAKAALSADATPADKTKATRSVNLATTALDLAQTAVTELQGELDALPAEAPQT